MQENAFNYDKGVLAEILEPIMGKGLIPADLETWKPRRRAIVPAFHKAYIEAMIKMFGRCTQVAVQKLDGVASSGQVTIPSCSERNCKYPRFVTRCMTGVRGRSRAPLLTSAVT